MYTASGSVHEKGVKLYTKQQLKELVKKQKLVPVDNFKNEFIGDRGEGIFEFEKIMK